MIFQSAGFKRMQPQKPAQCFPENDLSLLFLKEDWILLPIKSDGSHFSCLQRNNPFHIHVFNWWSGERSAKYTRTQLSLWRDSARLTGKSCAWQPAWSLNASTVTYWLCECEQVAWFLNPGFCVSNGSGNVYCPEQRRSAVPTEPGLR